MSFFDNLKSSCSTQWEAYTQHEFVQMLGDGSLPENAFKTYLVQDYLFLIQFARAHALAIYKSRSLADMRAAAAGVSAILNVEMDLHVSLCAKWGLSADALENADEAAQTIAYTRFVLEAGHAGDILDLMVALSPCMIGYAEIARNLVEKYGPPADDHPYRSWIEEYSGNEYQQVANDTLVLLEKHASELVTPARIPDLTRLFGRASMLEADFWQMGLQT